MTSAEEIIKKLQLSPHPEGGWFRETWRADAPAGERASGTAIYYLLQKGERSHWHRVDAAEIWHYYAGAPLALFMSSDGVVVEQYRLGSDIESGACPQIIVPKDVWQAAESLGEWTLVGCTVSPGFQFEGFELAPEGWAPKGG